MQIEWEQSKWNPKIETNGRFQQKGEEEKEEEQEKLLLTLFTFNRIAFVK